MAIPNFAALLASFPRPGDSLGYTGTWREGAMRPGLHPVLHNWVSGYAVDAEGQVFAADDDAWTKPRPVAEPRLRHALLAEAATRYPELAPLRPIRGPGDPVCPTCHGRLEVPQAAGVLCDCGNLGWVPAGAV